MYLFHAELTSLQRLAEAHLPMEESLLVYQRGGLLQARTHWNALGQVGVEAHGDVVPGEKRENSVIKENHLDQNDKN